MHQSRGLTTAIAIALAVIITAGGVSLGGSYVLCVGVDGHADLELALGVCCTDDGPGGEPAGESSTIVVDSCSGCADIGLDASSLTEGKHRLAPPRFAVIDTADQDDASLQAMVDPDRVAEPGPPHLEDLQTVVLQT